VTVIDYAYGRPSPASLRAAGVSGVARYLSYLPNSKVITPVEYAAHRAAGIDVVLVWERDAQDFMTPGFDARHAAIEALRQAHALGYPSDAAIYYALDWDVTATQWPTIRDKLRTGPCAVHGVDRTGVYGPSDTLEWARRAGVASWLWQAGMSTAWSGGRNRDPWPGAHLRQRRPATIGGVQCDINDHQPNYGQGGADVALTDAELKRIVQNVAASIARGTWEQGYCATTFDPAYRDALAGRTLMDLRAAIQPPVALTDTQVTVIGQQVTAILDATLDDRIESAVRRVLGSLDNDPASGVLR
jgi:hypothetical protein